MFQTENVDNGRLPFGDIMDEEASNRQSLGRYLF